MGFNLFPFEMAVVLDNGGFSVKIGYSTDEEPRCIFISKLRIEMFIRCC